LKNIALFVIDCLRYDDSKILENALNLSAQKLGVDKLDVFESCYSTAPWTYPSTNSILTGRYPHKHGAIQFGDYKYSVTKPWPNPLCADTNNIFESLSSKGYQTIGISTIFWALNPQCDYGELDHLIRSEKQDLEYRNIPASWVVDEAVDVIEKIDREPWFLYAHLADLHRPYDLQIAQDHSAEKIAILEGMESWDLRVYFDNKQQLSLFKRNKRALYRALILYVSEQITRFIEFLDSKGQLNNTTVLISADHGEEFWNHEEEQQAYYNCGYRSESDWQLGFGHGHTLYEELIHVPLMVLNSPTDVETDDYDQPVSHVDIFPTIMHILNFDIPDNLDGFSIYSTDMHENILSEAILYGFEKKSYISKEQKVIFAPHEGIIEIFDRASDPEEKSPERLKFSNDDGRIERLKKQVGYHDFNAI